MQNGKSLEKRRVKVFRLPAGKPAQLAKIVKPETLTVRDPHSGFLCGWSRWSATNVEA